MKNAEDGVEEETVQMLRVEYRSVRNGDVEAAKGREERYGEFRDVLLEVDVVNQMNKQSGKRGAVARREKDHI